MVHIPPSASVSTTDAMPAVLTQWADAICAAAQGHQALHIRGGRSKDFLSPPIKAGDTVLDTRGYAGIVAYEPSELVVTARAGTRLDELNAELARCGQCLAFDPPHFGPDATVGGMVAAGLSGPSRASVGSVRDFVLGLHALNGRGEAVEFGGQVMKNVAGYDISRVFAGSWGSLGVITQVSLKVLPVAPADATVCFTLGQAEALAQLARWRARPLPIHASCWVTDTSASDAQPHLYVRLQGAAAAVEAAVHALCADAPGMRVDTAQATRDWLACRDQQLPFFVQPPSSDAALWRVSVAPTSPVLPGAWPTLIEWHGGLRWVWAPLSQGPALRQMAQTSGGHATVFRLPSGLVDTDGRHTTPPAAVLAIQQRLKQAFDPSHVFNPGRWGFGL